MRQGTRSLALGYLDYLRFRRTMKKVKYYPFSCGSQYADWMLSNCDRCKKYKYELEDENDFPCEIDRALLSAFWDDGGVTREIARRMGYFKNKGKYNWMCTEVEWTEEWKKKQGSVLNAEENSH